LVSLPRYTTTRGMFRCLLYDYQVYFVSIVIIVVV